jgi:hypothetical protein
LEIANSFHECSSVIVVFLAPLQVPARPAIRTGRGTQAVQQKAITWGEVEHFL